MPRFHDTNPGVRLCVGLGRDPYDATRTIAQECNTIQPGCCVAVSDGTIVHDAGAVFVAANGREVWAITPFPEGGYLDSFGRQFAESAPGPVGPDGAIAIKVLYYSYGPWDVIEPDGSRWRLTDGDAFDIQLLGAQRAIWRESADPGRLFLRGVQVDQPLGEWGAPRLIDVAGDFKLLYQSYTGGALVFDGHIVATGANFYRPDAIVRDGVLYVAWSTQPQEVGVTQEISIPLDQLPLLPPLVLPAPPTPEPEPPPDGEFMDPWKVTITHWDDTIQAGERFALTADLGNGVSVLFEKNAEDSLHVTVAKDGAVQDASGAVRHVEVIGEAPPPEPPEPTPEPELEPATLRTHDGVHFLVAPLDGEVHAQAADVFDASLFVFERHGDRFAIRAECGLYLRAEDGGHKRLLVDRDAPNVDPAVSNELFTVTQDGAAIAIASMLGTFVSAEDGGGGAVSVDRPSAGVWETFTLDPPTALGPGPVTAPALVVDGEYFRGADGTRWTGIQTSDFSLLKRYLEHEDITPILAERAAIGFNLLRVWTLNESVVGQVYPQGIHPSQYPDFYAEVRSFAEMCGAYGFAVEFTAFTSCIPLMPGREDQERHWRALQDAVRGLPFVLLELVNEYDWGEGQNAPDRALWEMRPVGILASSGSSTADAPPSEPVWDYVLYHTNGLSEWQRRVGHNAWEWGAHYRCPGASNENMRYPDDDNSTLHAYDAAAGAALLCASACFHSQGGKYSRPFDTVERAAAEAWVQGARSVPLEFQTGQYIRRDDLLTDEVIRAYERRLPDGRSHVVLIHA